MRPLDALEGIAVDYMRPEDQGIHRQVWRVAKNVPRVFGLLWDVSPISFVANGVLMAIVALAPAGRSRWSAVRDRSRRHACESLCRSLTHDMATSAKVVLSFPSMSCMGSDEALYGGQDRPS